MCPETIQYVEVELIVVKSQVRDALEGEQPEGLAQSMKAVGLQQPVRLRREGVQLVIVDGERRYWAAKLLGWKQIPAIIEERDLSEAEVIQRQLIANCHRKALKPAEFGQAVEDLIAATGWKLVDVRGVTGFSIASLSRHRPLATLPSTIRQQVDAGDIPANTAYHLARLTDPVEQEKLAEAVAAGELTRDAVCAKVSALNHGAASEKASLSRVKVSMAQAAVTISGPDLTPETITDLLAELLKRARRAISRGVAGHSFLLALREPLASKKQAISPKR